MYRPQLTASTAIHANHCSTYLRANIHIPTILRAVVKLSSHGTLLSVKLIKIQPIPIKVTRKTKKSDSHTFLGQDVMGNSSDASSKWSGVLSNWSDVDSRHDDSCYPQIDTGLIFQPKVNQADQRSDDFQIVHLRNVMSDESRN